MNFEANLRNRLEELNDVGELAKIGIIEPNNRVVMDAVRLINKNRLANIVLIFEKRSQIQGDFDDFECVVIEENKEKAFMLADKYFKNRNKKDFSIHDARSEIMKAPLYAAYMLKSGEIDGLVGGIDFQPSDIMKYVSRVSGLKHFGAKLSTAVILSKPGKEDIIFSDVQFNENPSSDELFQIAQNAIELANHIKLEKNVAFLSYSSNGSALNDETKKVQEASTKLRKLKLENTNVIGEVQFDAAFDENIRKSKLGYDPGFKGPATIYVFPNLNSANISWKIASNFAKYNVIGPIWLGFDKSCNIIDVFAKINDIYNTIIITAIQVKERRKGINKWKKY